MSSASGMRQKSPAVACGHCQHSCWAIAAALPPTHSPCQKHFTTCSLLPASLHAWVWCIACNSSPLLPPLLGCVWQVRAARAKNSAAAIAAKIAAEGYDSDEEVYATAKAMAAEEGEEGEGDIAAKVGGGLRGLRARGFCQVVACRVFARWWLEGSEGSGLLLNPSGAHAGLLNTVSQTLSAGQ